MKKILICLLLLLLNSFNFSSVSAETVKIKAEALGQFSTNKPATKLKIKTLDTYNLATGETIPVGAFFEGDIVNVGYAKRGKQNGYLMYKLDKYISPDCSKTIAINNKNAIGKVILYTPVEMQETALNVGTSVANHFVKNIAYPINFARGIIQPYEDKTRLESGVQKVYENSFLSYASKGKDIEFKSGDKIILIFTYNVMK